tara:strand:- start:128 stop:508 length:381 start_codon:yes stop_codon:yes gene_type:complete
MEKITEKHAKAIIKIFALDKQSRKPIVTDNRFLFFRFLNEHGYKLKQIAELFNTTHPNVLYGVRKSKADSASNKLNYVRNTEVLRHHLNNKNTDLKRLEAVRNVKAVQDKLDVLINKINAFNEETI